MDQTEQVQNRKKRGCRNALIVAAVALVVVEVAAVGSVVVVVARYCYYYYYSACPSLAMYAINKSVSALEDGMIEKLPAGYDAEEVHKVFRDLKTAFREGKISGPDIAPKIQSVSENVKAALEDDKLTTEEVDQILKKLRALAGTSE